VKRIFKNITINCKTKLYVIPFLSILFLNNYPLQAQDAKSERIVFYNVENLFDTENDSIKNDDEFTPDGSRNWNNYRFYDKLNNIYKVIISVGEWEPPAVVGLCEIENRFVLNQLVYETPLKRFDYKIVHFESPDRRGIDVALIYRYKRFEPIHSEPIQINFPDNINSKTRDILYVKGVMFENDTIHFFMNHWPSRWGGYLETKPKREFVASMLRLKVDSILNVDNDPHIIIMGDFNDEPWDESVKVVLNAKLDSIKIEKGDLLNLMSKYEKDWLMGTSKYKEDWSVIDQFIISANLLSEQNAIQVSDKGAQIHNLEFLLEDDKTHGGEKPFRMFTGYRYNGGFSDHLPIFLDVIKK